MRQLNLIVAACQDLGIGLKGELPWDLKSEMAHFRRMTKETKDPKKQNAVIMGRRTWNSLPQRAKPLPGRINFVLSTTMKSVEAANTFVAASLESALQKLSEEPLQSRCETIWAIGGTAVYNAALASGLCHRIYLTRIFHKFECDTYLTPINTDIYKLVKTDADEVPQGRQKEKDIEFEYFVYQKIKDD